MWVFTCADPALRRPSRIFILNFSFFGKTFLLNHLAYIFAVKFRLVWLGPLWKSLEVILLFLFIKIGNFFKFEICRIRRSGKFEN